MRNGQPVRAALVHDWLNQDGGAEAVLEVLHGMFPTAPVITTIADASRVPAIAAWDVRTTWMNRLPRIHRNHQPYVGLYPLAWGAVRLRGYDVVLSNKSGFCHGVRSDGAPHICYCLTPTRFVWEPESYLRHEPLPAGAALALRALLPWLRRWDRAAADRVDRFVAISGAVKERIERIYGRESEVIHPPVEMLPSASGPPSTGPTTGPDGSGGCRSDPYYLVLARLVPYKRIDVAVEACNHLGRTLVIVGDGRDRPRLEALAGPTVSFRGRLPREEVLRLAAGCRALLWPGVEDFGLAPVEVMSAGRPVVALRAGGVLDTVEEGLTGAFFDVPTPHALSEAIVRSEAVTWVPDEIRRRALRFSRDRFERQLRDVVSDTLEEARRPAVRRQAARSPDRGEQWTNRPSAEAVAEEGQA